MGKYFALAAAAVSAVFAAGLRADVPPPDALTWHARMPDEKLKVNKVYRVPVRLEFNRDEGYAGVYDDLAFMLQLSVPDCVRLVAEDRARRYDTPYERYFIDGVAYVDFELRKKPKPGDFIAMNLCGYLDRAASGSAAPDRWFVRQRANLFLERRADLRPAASERSQWGDEPDRLEIGDRAPPFALPDVEGNVHDLRDYLGSYYVVLAMFRHHEDQFSYLPLVDVNSAHQEFDKLGAKVIAVAKEDRSLEDLNKLVRRFAKQPPFVTFLLDVGGEATRRYDPITYYLIDKEGIIRQIMPGTPYVRPSPQALLNELAVFARQGPAATQPAEEAPTTQPAAEADEGS